MTDLDIEFLHHYRVSFRRARSLLSLFEGVFSNADNRFFRTTLAEIMKQTNRLRDLDVYLLERRKYYNLVPDSMHEGLNIIFDTYFRERQNAFEKVRDFLGSSEYHAQMSGLLGLFERQEVKSGESGGEPSGTYVSRFILEYYRNAVGVASLIKPDTPDRILHELRILCKKLRYSMEFFSEIFPDISVQGLVKPLKRIQDVLGKFNDYSVQRHSLTKFLDEHPLRGENSILLADSTGMLISKLYQLQIQLRNEIETCIGEFINENTRILFEELFFCR